MCINERANGYLYNVWPETFGAARLIECIVKKETPRQRKSFRFEIFGVVWRVEVADTEVSRFYLRRSARWARYLASEVGDQFIVKPYKTGVHKNVYVSVTPEVAGTVSHTKNPSEWMLRLGGAKLYTEISSELLHKIEKGFLQAWPRELRQHIKRLEQYSAWVNATSSLRNIKIVTEHGDLWPGNILNTERGLKLIDFEFVKPFQVSGFDMYSNLRSRKLPMELLDAPLLHALNCKWNLIQAINKYWQHQCLEVTVCKSNGCSVSFAANQAMMRPWVISGTAQKDGRLILDDEAVANIRLLPDDSARMLVNRWFSDGQRVLIPNISRNTFVGRYLRSLTFLELLRQSFRNGKPLRTLRRVVCGKQLFVYNAKSNTNKELINVAYGNIRDYLRDFLNK